MSAPHDYNSFVRLWDTTARLFYYLRLTPGEAASPYDTMDIMIRAIVNNGASVKEVELAPSSFALFQNMPNPFNPVTSISYMVDVSGKVELEVYNVLGNKVTSLVNEEQTPGFYSVQFDGRDMPSGVYFYKLTTGEKTLTKKMLLAK
jgi:hypothetical protein